MTKQDNDNQVNGVKVPEERVDLYDYAKELDPEELVATSGTGLGRALCNGIKHWNAESNRHEYRLGPFTIGY